jgi:hypothetical protein
MLPRPPHEPAGRWSQRIRVPVRDPGQGNGCVSVGGLLCTRRDLTRQRRYRFPTWIARDASFGVRQPCCRAHRTNRQGAGRSAYGCRYVTLVKGMDACRLVACSAHAVISPASVDTASLPGLPVTHRLECGSHAAAPTVLTIRCVVSRYPSWSRGCRVCS